MPLIDQGQDLISKSGEIQLKSDGDQLLAADKFIDPTIDYEKVTYDFCMQYFPELVKLASYIVARGRNQYDNQVAIEGETGSGKSMFTLVLSLVMCYRLHRQFNMTRQCLFIPSEGELKDKLKNLRELDLFWIDESIRALDKKTWYKKDQIELNQIVKTERYKKNTIFYCIQRFSELQESFRNSNIFFRICIIPRKYAVLRVKDRDFDTGAKDPWHTDHNIKLKTGFRSTELRNSYNVTIPTETWLEWETRMPNYEMHTRFPNLENHPILKDYYNYYFYLKDMSRKKKDEYVSPEEEKISKSGLKYKTALVRLLKMMYNDQKFNKRELLEKIGKPIGEITWTKLFKEKL